MGVTEHGATLEAQVNPHGEQTYLTTWAFEYGPSSTYGQSTPTPPGVFDSEACKYIEIVPCGINTPQPVSESLMGLAPATTYHYRIAATNSWGTSYGEDRTFTTSGAQSSTSAGQSTGAQTAGGTGKAACPNNDSPTGCAVADLTPGHGKRLTRAQKLAKALEQCKKARSKSKRTKCGATRVKSTAGRRND